MQQEFIETKYTVVPVVDFAHQEKLEKYLSSNNDCLKRSYCRFYLRGNCIMKAHFCKFAHDFGQLKIEQEDRTHIQYFATQKERRKKQFIQKYDFNQKALFLIKNVDYIGLYEYQFSPRYRKRQQKQHTLKQIKADNSIRHRIREVMHRQQWDGLLHFLEEKYSNVDFSVSFLSYWFQKVGFSKLQSRCKFGDFMRYMIFVAQYKQIEIVMPPRIKPLLFFINSKRQATYLEQNLMYIIKIIEELKQEQQKTQQIILKELPIELSKKYICRYYMAGNCIKTSEGCFYVHNIQELKYTRGQMFPPEYRQPTKSIEFRLNYHQIFLYSKFRGFNHSLEEINSNPALRTLLRHQMHLQIYKGFVELILREWGLKHLPMFILQKQYYNTGFNHTDQNKFAQLKDSLWEIGYHVEQLPIPENHDNKKTPHVIRIPPIQVMDQYYKKTVEMSIFQQLKKANQHKIEKEEVLESTIRRNVYSLQQYSEIPLHVYLRLKKCTFQNLIQLWFPEVLPRIFFETSTQNMKKLIQIVKKYFKERKQYIHKLQSIEMRIKQHHENSINLNHFINFKIQLQQAIIECGKKVYFWPFSQNTIIVDKGSFGIQQKAQKEAIKKQKQVIIIPLPQQLPAKFSGERMILIDNLEALEYAKLVMMSTNRYGLDLQGKLSKEGKIDLIQFSVQTKHSKVNIEDSQKPVEIPLKQILIFDLFLIEKEASQRMECEALYQETKSFLKFILEDEGRVKILHDCRQDSIALYYVLGVDIKNVFDTSGMYIYLEQKGIYDHSQGSKSAQLIRQIHQVKVPGLNAVLHRWQAPNGINVFKQEMKKRFHSEKRAYFQQRPINPQFLQYSAQDVQDLVQIYENMKAKDVDLLSRYIGEIYCKVDAKKDDQTMVNSKIQNNLNTQLEFAISKSEGY